MSDSPIYKSITFPIHSDDIRPLIKSHVLSVISRNGSQLQKILSVMDEIFDDEERTQDIVPAITDLCTQYRMVAAQVEVCLQMASLLSDTEVLEDLPDLEEDSLGVDSGSE
jgi:hypothetical protein